MARVFVASLVLSHAAAASASNSTSNLRGRSLGSCDYRCPENSHRKPNRRCYDTFDDCECDNGFKQDGKKCVQFCDNAYQCPRNAYRKPNRKCYDTFDDCECEQGFKKDGFKCVQFCDNTYQCPGNSSRKPNRKCYDTFDDCECFSSFKKQDKECVSQEPCVMILCSSGQVLVDTDARGCGGRCEPKPPRCPDCEMLTGMSSSMSAAGGLRFYWSFDGSYCMSVDDNVFQNGQGMQLWKCADGIGQYFDYSPAHQSLPALLKVAASPEYCVVIDGNNNFNGAGIQLWRCDANAKAQQWFVDASGLIVNAAFSDKCLVVDSNRGANGQRLQLWSCADDEQYKSWGRAV